jgi:putative lipase involved disintegration of autophagic bodies
VKREKLSKSASRWAKQAARSLGNIPKGRVWVLNHGDGGMTASLLESHGIPVTRFYLLNGNECSSCKRPRLLIFPSDAPLYELSVANLPKVPSLRLRFD